MEFYISQKDWKKVIHFAQASYNKFKSEIGGFMIVKKNKAGNYIVSNPEILKQEVTGGTTEMEKEAVADYYVKTAMKEGSDVRFLWWHSHANMSAFWSGTDTNTMKEYKNGDWSAFLVVNIRGEYKFRVCVWNPIQAHEDIELNILGMENKSVPKSIQTSVDKLCNKPTTSIVNIGQQTNLYNRKNNSYHYAYDNYNIFSDDTYETNHYNSSFYNDNLYNSTVVLVNELVDLYVEGDFTYEEWLKEVRMWNKTLKKKKASFNIKELTMNQLQSNSTIYSGYNAKNLLNLKEI